MAVVTEGSNEIPLRWQFLNDEEKRRLEQFDADIATLTAQRVLTSGDKALEEDLRVVKRRYDAFIIHLYEKYKTTK